MGCWHVSKSSLLPRLLCLCLSPIIASVTNCIIDMVIAHKGLEARQSWRSTFQYCIALLQPPVSRYSTPTSMLQFLTFPISSQSTRCSGTPPAMLLHRSRVKICTCTMCRTLDAQLGNHDLKIETKHAMLPSDASFRLCSSTCASPVTAGHVLVRRPNSADCAQQSAPGGRAGSNRCAQRTIAALCTSLRQDFISCQGQSHADRGCCPAEATTSRLPGVPLQLHLQHYTTQHPKAV